MSIPLKPASMPSAAAGAGANTYSNLNGLAALKKDPGSPQAIKAVAQQIDAMFLQMMLKSMRDAGAEVGEQASNEMGMYQDMFDKQIALNLSQHQSLGLGAQLTRQMAAAAAATPAAGAPATAAPAAGAPPTSPDTAAGLPPPAGLRTDPDAGAEPPGTAALPSDPAQFVSEVYPAIERAAQGLGVNPLAMLAQAALETGWGRRMARGSDGTPSRNLFGIKADDRWTGARMAADTVEFSGGVATQRRTAFRAYGSIEESVNDFARLLASSPRYRDAVAGGANAQAYVSGIGRSGYATDPNYENKLNEIMNSSAFRNAVRNRSVVL